MTDRNLDPFGHFKHRPHDYLLELINYDKPQYDTQAFSLLDTMTVEEQQGFFDSKYKSYLACTQDYILNRRIPFFKEFLFKKAKTGVNWKK